MASRGILLGELGFLGKVDGPELPGLLLPIPHGFNGCFHENNREKKQNEDIAKSIVAANGVYEYI